MKNQETVKQPKVSIIVPVRNEVKHIGNCLDSLLLNNYPEEQIEILVVDGMSDDGTREIVGQRVKSGQPLVLLDNPKKIVPTAMNIGIRHAKGQIIMRADAHTFFEESYIAECVQTLLSKNCDNVGGPMRVLKGSTFQNAVGFATSSLFGLGGSAFHFDSHEGYVDTVYLGTYPKKVFDIHGLFDEAFVRNQDDEFNFRLRKAGGKIYLSPRIRSHYTPRGDLASLWRQYFQYGFWKVAVARKHPSMMRLRHYVPFCFIVSLMLFGILGLTYPAIGHILTPITIAYVLLSVAFSLWIALQRGAKYLFVLPVLFGCLHCAYGLGFAFGLFARKIERWRR